MKNINEGADIFDVMFNTTRARNAEIAALGQDQELHEHITAIEKIISDGKTMGFNTRLAEAVIFLLKLEASRR